MKFSEMDYTDSAVSHSILADMLPQEHVEEFASLLTSARPSKRVLNEALEAFTRNTSVNQVYATAVVFLYFKNSSYRHIPSRQYVHDLAKRLSYRDSLDLFFAQSESMVTEILKLVLTSAPGSINAYLRALTKIGANDVWSTHDFRYLLEHNTHYSLDDVEALRKMGIIQNGMSSIFEFSSRDAKGYLDCEYPSNEYIFLILSSRPILYSFDNLKATLLVFWKMVYGEKLVLEVIQKFENEDCYLEPDQFADVLEDWENLKNFSPTWIAALLGSEIQEDFGML